MNTVRRMCACLCPWPGLGNEAFHANELERAVKHYSASLELVPGSAVVLANR